MARQRFSSPRLHGPHVPQPIHGCASRRSPTVTPFAAGPAATTSPTFSWPSVTGSFIPRSARLSFLPPPRSNQPSARCRSLWQTPAARTFSRTSLPAGFGVGCSLSCSGWPHTQTWNIRIGRSPGFFCRNSEPQSAVRVTPRGVLDALHLHVDGRAALDGLINDAIALGELEQLIKLVLRGFGVEIDAQPDLRETNRRIFGNAE